MRDKPIFIDYLGCISTVMFQLAISIFAAYNLSFKAFCIVSAVSIFNILWMQALLVPWLQDELDEQKKLLEGRENER